eukprot:SM000042S15374  [mRNA]  locus=s42:603348:605987:+ [translate_table: standard]
MAASGAGRPQPTLAASRSPAAAAARASQSPTTPATNVLQELLQSNGGFGVVDGGLGTELEARGAVLIDPLWSAKCLLNDDLCDLVRQVHLDYLRAGADIIISASYQATIQGFMQQGFSKRESEELLVKSVQLAMEARDLFCSEQASTPQRHGYARPRPLVAASVGSYGAYLADGSEYSGDYGPDVTVEVLMDFHRRRLEVLADSGADLLAIETIPSLQEGEAFVRLLEEGESWKVPAWLSFNSLDGSTVVRGDAFEDCIALGERCKQVVAVGINCTPPQYISDLLRLSTKVTSKPLVVYPNKGETYNGQMKHWTAPTGELDNGFVSFLPEWQEAGASLIGGCCQTTPNSIKAIAAALRK